MKNLRKTGLAALLLAVSLGGYAVCMENVQAAGEDVELEMEEVSDEQELTTEDQNTSEEEIVADLSGDQGEQELTVEEDQEAPAFSDDENAGTDQNTESGISDEDTTETEKSGFCGTEDSNVNWSLDEEGILHITGEGTMASWESEADVPWAQYRSQIKEIQIEDGVTSVGAYAFCNCSDVTETVLPDSIKNIGEFAFFSCGGLSTVTIG